MSIEEKTIFIVPYRNRESDKEQFLESMLPLLKDNDELFFVHQHDERLFNRGAMKNLGFLIMKEKYPNDYQDINFIFNDVDTFPSKGTKLPYKTTHGTVAHYYGFKNSLGGIFAIKGNDFEKTGGFPNHWGWGFEDIVLHDRCQKQNLVIDRSIFYDFGTSKFIKQTDTKKGYRITTKTDIQRARQNVHDSFHDISDIKYNTEGKFINITSFTIPINFDQNQVVKCLNTSKISIKRRNVDLRMANIMG